jgi:hypothetical protein
MEIDLETILDSISSKPITFPDLHLKSAISGKPVKLFNDHLRGGNCRKPFFCRKSADEFKRITNSGVLIDNPESFYPLLMAPSPRADSDSQRLDKKALDITKIQLSIVVKTLHELLKETLAPFNQYEVLDTLGKWGFTPIISHLANTRDFWEDLRNKMHQKRQNSDFKFVIYQKTLWETQLTYVNSHFACIIDHPGGNILVLDYDRVLMMLDTVTSRFLSHFYCDFFNKIGEYQTITSDQLTSLYKWGDEVLVKQGNLAYNTIKFVESICIAKLIHDDPACPQAAEFLGNMIEKAGEKGDYVKEGVVELSNLIDKIKLTNIGVLEAYCIYRHWGHPQVNVIEGCKNQQKNTKAKKKINKATVNHLLGIFNRSFIISFIKQHGRWPKCFIPERLNHSLIHKLWRNHDVSYQDFEDVIPLREWATVIMDQEFVFDYCSNFTLLADDKAISPGKDFYLSVYNHEMLGFKTPQPPTSRRVILEMLFRDELEIKEICNRIMRREVPLLWLVVGLHPKERELKIEPRLFAMLVLEMRIYFCITEKNLADSILRYFPQQTMTSDEATLMKHFYEVTGKSPSDYQPIVISVDFVAWCQNWRKESTEDIFRQFDRLFGTPGLYTYTHEFFQQAFFYLSSSLDPPELQTKTGNIFPDCDTTWNGQLGGCEGLRQKGWTIITIMLLLLVERTTGIIGIITGSGDNQLIVAYFPKNQKSKTLENELKNYLLELHRIANDIGLEVKLTETYCSSRLFLYGKEPIYDGKMMPMVLKRISRAYPDVSEQFPGLGTKVASICTTGQAAALKGLEPISPYLITTFEIVRTLIRDCRWSLITQSPLISEKKLDESSLLCLLNMPRCLSLFPILPFPEYLYRGHPDPVTSCIGFLNISCKHFPLLEKILHWVQNHMKKADTEDPMMLIQDPTSLNIEVPVLSSNVVKARISASITPRIKNKPLKTLFSIDFQKEEEELVKCLSSVRPAHPRVWNDIYAASPPGTKASFLAKFNNLRTSKQLMPPSEQQSVYAKVKDLEKKWLIHVVKITDQVKRCKIAVPMCSSALAQHLRDKTWKTFSPVCGVTVPHPMEQTTIVESIGETCHLCLTNPEHIEIFLESSTSLRLTSRGSNPVYVGSKTTEKTSTPIAQVENPDNAYKSAQRLYRTREWLAREKGYFYQLLTDLISCRTDVHETTLAASTGISFGGSVTHRFQMLGGAPEAVVNTRPNLNTQAYLSSDSMGKFSKGYTNYLMHFQGIFLMNLSLLSILEFLSPQSLTGRRYFHVHLICCEEKIEDPPMDTHILPPVFEIRRDNPLLFSKTEDIIQQTTWMKSGLLHMITPNSSLPDFKRKASDSVICNLLGSASRKLASLVHTRAVQSSQMGGLKLSIGEFLSLGLMNIMSSFARIWLYDNWGGVLQYAISRQMDVSHVLMVFLTRSPELYWEGIRQFLPLKETMSQMIFDLEIFPIHAEATKGGRGLDATLMRWVYRRCLYLIKTKALVQTIYTPGPSFSITRILLSWFQSLLIHTNHVNNLTYKEQVSLISECRRVVQQDKFSSVQNLIRWILDPHQLTILKLSRDNLYIKLPINISSVGTDTWLALSKKFGPLSLLHTGFRPVDLRGQDSPPLIFNIDISFVLESPFELSHLLPPDEPFEKRVHQRQDHEYRLFGLYATAHYKASNIIRSLSLGGYITGRNVATLAEGSGSIAKLLGNYYQAKRIIFNTLLDVHGFIPHRASSYCPAELLNLQDGCELHGVKTSLLSGGDFSQQDTVEKYIALVRVLGVRLSFYSVDAEQPIEQTIESSVLLVQQVVSFISSTREDNWCLIYKTYCHNLSILYPIIMVLSELGGRMRIVVPHFSSHESYEIYIVIEGSSPPLVIRTEPTLRAVRYLMDSSYLISTLGQLRTSRIAPLPFQTTRDVSVDHQIAQDSGFLSNFDSSMMRVCNNLWIYNTDTLNNLKREIMEMNHMCRMILRDHIIISKKLQRGDKLQSGLRECYYHKHSEYISTQNLIESLLNLSMIQSVSESRFNMIINLLSEEFQFFTIKLDYLQWLNKYSRAIFRIRGHIKRVSMTDFLID